MYFAIAATSQSDLQNDDRWCAWLSLPIVSVVFADPCCDSHIKTTIKLPIMLAIASTMTTATTIAMTTQLLHIGKIWPFMVVVVVGRACFLLLLLQQHHRPSAPTNKQTERLSSCLRTAVKWHNILHQMSNNALLVQQRDDLMVISREPPTGLRQKNRCVLSTNYQ